MTVAQEPNEIDGPHEGPIKTPRQLIMAILCGFLIPITVIVLLAVFVETEPRPSAGSDAFTAAATEARIRPVARVEVKDASDVAAMKTGEQVFAGQCTTCHTAGMLGAPKFGDVAAWAPRIKTGFEALLHSALAGKNAMPPQGGGDFSDLEIARAVVYMANKGGAKFSEPPVPAASTLASAGASSPEASGTSVTTAPGAAETNKGRPSAGADAPLNAAAVAPTAGPTNFGTQPVVVAAVTGQATPAAATAAAPPTLFAQVCTACHSTGAAGAPKVGDRSVWAPRIAQGIDALTASAIKGKGAMPPRGGSTASDADIKAVVTYMVSASK
jgi:cytochrome c5